jgi:HD-GYP domain-containing protein (c-di-GMP phosphodiesterase class II)
VQIARKRRPGGVGRDLVGALKGLQSDDGFWRALHAGDVTALLSLVGPLRTREAGEEGLDRIAEAFASVIDAKSPFTHDHSRRVSDLAVAIGRKLGVDGAALVRLRRAALLHDVGKLCIPNRILDKPAGLTSSEWTVVRKHPQFTYEILDRVPIFREFAFDASCHHEKLDGSGYFRQLSGSAISATARILVVADIVDALLAERPYRPGLPVVQIVGMLRAERGRTLAADCVDAAIEVVVAGAPLTPDS